MVIKGNVMKKMELQKQVLLSYSVLYPDRHDKIEDLLSNVPSNTAIEFIGAPAKTCVFVCNLLL